MREFERIPRGRVANFEKEVDDLENLNVAISSNFFPPPPNDLTIDFTHENRFPLSQNHRDPALHHS